MPLVPNELREMLKKGEITLDPIIDVLILLGIMNGVGRHEKITYRYERAGGVPRGIHRQAGMEGIRAQRRGHRIRAVRELRRPERPGLQMVSGRRHHYQYEKRQGKGVSV